VTASDFHKSLCKISEQHPDGMPHLHLEEIVMQLREDAGNLKQHLQTLFILGLVQFYDDDKQVFSLTESGKLANLP